MPPPAVPHAGCLACWTILQDRKWSCYSGVFTQTHPSTSPESYWILLICREWTGIRVDFAGIYRWNTISGHLGKDAVYRKGGINSRNFWAYKTTARIPFHWYREFVLCYNSRSCQWPTSPKVSEYNTFSTGRKFRRVVHCRLRNWLWICGRSHCLLLVFKDKCIYLDADRGPFKSSHDLMLAKTDMQIERIKHLSPIPTDDYYCENDEGLAEEKDIVLETCYKLKRLVPTVFQPPSLLEMEEHAVLYHRDISENNIIVNTTSYRITGFIDWECIGLCPVWDSIDYSFFFKGVHVYGPTVPHLDNHQFLSNFRMTGTEPAYGELIGELTRKILRLTPFRANDVSPVA